MMNKSLMPKDRFENSGDASVDYKDVNLLQKYTSSQGKIFDAGRTGANAKNQRALARAVKRARFLALIKYCG